MPVIPARMDIQQCCPIFVKATENLAVVFQMDLATGYVFGFDGELAEPLFLVVVEPETDILNRTA